MIKRPKFFWPLLGCITLMVYLPLMFFPGGIAHFHSDYAPGVIIAEQFKRSGMTLFHWDMTYGGTLFTGLRALFTTGLESLLTTLGRPEPYLESHLLFTFGLMPLILNSSVAFFLRGMVPGFWGSFFGITFAVGLRYLDLQLPNEVYLSNLIFGSILLGFKARKESHPLTGKNWSTREIFFLAMVSGIALYQSRISALYLLPFWVDLSWAYQLLFKNLFKAKPTKALGQVVLWVSHAFLFLWVLLEFLGPNLGKVGDRTLKLHATPNLFFACVGYSAILAARFIRRRPIFELTSIRRFVALICGTLLPLLPELIRKIARPGSTQQPIGGAYSFSDAFTIFGLLPNRFHELLGDRDQVLGLALPLLFFICAGHFLFFLYRSRRTTFNQTLLLWTGLVCILAFARIYTGMGWAATRYLLPILPICFGILAFSGEIFWKSLNHGVRAGLILLLLIHLVFTLYSRNLFSKEASPNYLALGKTLLSFADENQLPIVLTDHYWDTNQWTMLSRGHVLFVAQGFPRPLTHPEAPPRLAATHRLGLMVRKGGVFPKEYLSPPWNLKSVVLPDLPKTENEYEFAIAIRAQGT